MSTMFGRYSLHSICLFHVQHLLRRTLSSVATTHSKTVCISPEPSNSESIAISDSCCRQLKKVLDSKDDMLRVQVLTGGCSGLQYKFDVCQTTEADDRVFERDGVKVVVDNESLQYMKNATVDYHQELIRSAFRVIGNPQSEQGCSCGASFAIKMDDNFSFK